MPIIAGATITYEERMRQAREMRDLYVAAERAVLLGQSYTIGGQSLTRANLAEIRKGRAEWEAILSGSGQRRIRQVLPVDCL